MFGADVGKPVEMPLDELERYAVAAVGIAIIPDKSRIYVTIGGSEIVTVVDVPRLIRYSRARFGNVVRKAYVGEHELRCEHGSRWGSIRGVLR